MPGYFADTSALAKLYIAERGSGWLQSLDLQGLAVSALVLPEIASVLSRREREGALDRRRVDVIWRRFRRDLAGWLAVPVSDGVLTWAATLLRGRGAPGSLRSLDALQLASALEAGRRLRQGGGPAIVVLTADERLETAARRHGLAVDNPNRHQ